jgi:hypothetical protein
MTLARLGVGLTVAAIAGVALRRAVKPEPAEPAHEHHHAGERGLGGRNGNIELELAWRAIGTPAG